MLLKYLVPFWRPSNWGKEFWNFIFQNCLLYLIYKFYFSCFTIICSIFGLETLFSVWDLILCSVGDLEICLTGYYEVLIYSWNFAEGLICFCMISFFLLKNNNIWLFNKKLMIKKTIQNFLNFQEIVF